MTADCLLSYSECINTLNSSTLVEILTAKLDILTMKKTFIFIIYMAQVFSEAVTSIQCKDENDKPVDWYVIYKIPRLKSFIIPDVRRGRGYMYITANSLNESWILSPKSIFNNNTAVANTLAPYYKNNDSELWLFYNDQPPGHRSSRTNKGHTKGVVGASSVGGFWLIHSVPHFPPASDKYSYAANGVINGQLFLCISLSPNELNNLGSNVLKYNGPMFYKVKINSIMANIYPLLLEVTEGRLIMEPPWYRESNITTTGSTQFHAFAKTKQFNEDLYGLVAQHLETDILTETWQDGIGRLPSNCNGTFKINNIKSISFKGMNFNSTNDHSKWALADNVTKQWICIGDINRAVTQEHRGGGTLCLNNLHLWTAFHLLVNNIEPCSKSKFSVQGKEYMSNAIPEGE